MTAHHFEPTADKSLASCNSLRLPACASAYARVTDTDALQAALEWADQQGQSVLVLGGGSNVILAGDFDGLVLKVGFTGRCWSNVSDDAAILELGAGENWHETVMYAVRSGYRGIENLALIPGTVGAAPIQNIGAYGTELADTLVDVDVWDRTTARVETLSRTDCAFGYRDSLFKRQPDRYVVLRLRLKLSRQAPLNIEYRDLREFFDSDINVDALSAEDVARAVIQVRSRKLPDPDFLPNVGSFFKNPVVSRSEYESLKGRFPDLVAYLDADSAKLAAGWMIDFCGWKGHREAHVGVHNRQALVLVHHGNGEGVELLSLASRIRDDVHRRFGVSLEVEPRIFPLALRDEFRF